MPLLIILVASAGTGVVMFCKTLFDDLLSEGCVANDYPKALPPAEHKEDQDQWDHEIALPEDPNPEVGEFPINALRNPPVLEYKPAPYSDEMQALLDRFAALENRITKMDERASGRAFAGPQDNPQVFPQQQPQERIKDPAGGIEWPGGDPMSAWAMSGYGGFEIDPSLTYDPSNQNHDVLARKRVFDLLNNGVTIQEDIIFKTWGIRPSGSSKRYQRVKPLYDKWLEEWKLNKARMAIESIGGNQ